MADLVAKRRIKGGRNKKGQKNSLHWQIANGGHHQVYESMRLLERVLGRDVEVLGNHIWHERALNVSFFVQF